MTAFIGCASRRFLARVCAVFAVSVKRSTQFSAYSCSCIWRIQQRQKLVRLSWLIGLQLLSAAIGPVNNAAITLTARVICVNRCPLSLPKWPKLLGSVSRLHCLRGGHGGAEGGMVLDDMVLADESVTSNTPDLHHDDTDDLEDGDSRGSDSGDAEWIYREALHVNPADVMALGALADVLYDKGDLDGALRCLDDALAVSPMHRLTLYSKGMLLLNRTAPGDSDAATVLFARAVEADPASVLSLHTYGRMLHFVHGRLEEAEDMYRRALFFEPKRGDILSDYGLLLEARGSDAETVRGMYKRASQLAPSNPDALNNYACVLEDLDGGCSAGDTRQTALSLYRRALASRPQHVPTMCNLALTLTSGSQGVLHRSEGLALLEQATTLQPAHVGALCQYARLLQEDGHLTQARLLFDQALGLEPNKIDALNGLGTIYEAGAQKVWLEAQVGDEEADARHHRLRDMADGMYTRALQLAPLHADTLCNSAVLHMWNAEPDGHDKAEHLFRRALSVKPTHAAAHYNFGFLRQTQQSMREAMELYERAYELEPFCPQIRAALAQFHSSKYAQDFIVSPSEFDPVDERARAEQEWRDLFRQSAQGKGSAKGETNVQRGNNKTTQSMVGGVETEDDSQWCGADSQDSLGGDGSDALNEEWAGLGNATVPSMASEFIETSDANHVEALKIGGALPWEVGAENVDVVDKSHAAALCNPPAAAVAAAARGGAEKARGVTPSLQKRGASEAGTGELPGRGEVRVSTAESPGVVPQGKRSEMRRGASDERENMEEEGDGRAVIPENLDVMLNVMASLSTPRESEAEVL